MSRNAQAIFSSLHVVSSLSPSSTAAHAVRRQFARLRDVNKNAVRTSSKGQAALHRLCCHCTAAGSEQCGARLRKRCLKSSPTQLYLVLVPGADDAALARHFLNLTCSLQCCLVRRQLTRRPWQSSWATPEDRLEQQHSQQWLASEAQMLSSTAEVACVPAW